MHLQEYAPCSKMTNFSEFPQSHPYCTSDGLTKALPSSFNFLASICSKEKEMSQEAEMFRAPVNRTMRILDRAFFHRDIPISAAKVADIKKLSRVRQTLLKSQEILNVRQYHPIQSVGEEKEGLKAVLLRPGIVCDGRFWGGAA